MECILPARFMDISDFRPVPDHQEVFGDGDRDENFIVEILEYKADVSDEDSARFFFTDLAEANEASDTKVTLQETIPAAEMPGLDGAFFKSLCVGEQVATKHRDSQEKSNVIMILLANIRLPKYTTDILVTFNSPVYVNPSSSSITPHAREAGKTAVEIGTQEERIANFKQALKTLKINDFGLFG